MERRRYARNGVIEPRNFCSVAAVPAELRTDVDKSIERF
jgi:hypothetical protein